MSFSGFSEDDIRKISHRQDTVRPEKGLQKPPAKRVTFKTNPVRRTEPKTKQTGISLDVINSISDEAKLDLVNEPLIKLSSNDAEASSQLSDKIKLEYEEPQLEKKIINLEQFEARQKLIEEQNRMRKELLAKALADRTKQTQEEAQRLNEIQNEFTKLDAMLSKDVKILRKQIEVASIDYTECQKRYHKIEKEFLDAKLMLHQKLEKKEMLTEHLCAIIEKNEERKADKLMELLNKLQINHPMDKCAEDSGNNAAHGCKNGINGSS